MTTGMAVGELTPSPNAVKQQQQLPVIFTSGWVDRLDRLLLRKTDYSKLVTVAGA